MQKIWGWICDRKTNTIRKWRSTLVRRPPSDETDMCYLKNGKQVGHSISDLDLPSTSKDLELDYEEFFDDPQTKTILDKRKKTLKACQIGRYPVIPPDLDDDWIESPVAPRATPQSTPNVSRSQRQIHFRIPEIEVSSSDIARTEPPLPLLPDEPPPEIEWESTTSMTETPPQKVLLHPALTHVPSLPSDGSDEVSTSSPRRNSPSERARQSLLAQRRESQVQLLQSMSGRRASTTLIPLTQAQIHLVRALWRQIYTSKGPTVLGTSMYHRLCFKCPEVKEQIRRVQLPSKFLHHDSFVKAHCKAIGELIDQVVDNLDNLDNMCSELIRIGKVHALLLRGELTGKLWNVVAETFIDCTLEWGDRRCRSETVRKAWALIVAFVIEKIKLGHHEQRKQMLLTRQSMPVIDVSSFHSMRI